MAKPALKALMHTLQLFPDGNRLVERAFPTDKWFRCTNCREREKQMYAYAIRQPSGREQKIGVFCSRECLGFKGEGRCKWI